MEAAIQDFPLSSLTAIASFFHSAALPNFSRKLARETVILLVLLSLPLFSKAQGTITLKERLKTASHSL